MKTGRSIYFAPMEGITGYIFRNAHRAYFGGVEKYFTPFLTPKPGKSLTTREQKDILPEHNRGILLTPQILTNQAEGFIKLAVYLQHLGYEEVNLNLGCPSGTVVAKGKGAGFLAYPDRLEAFLDEIFTSCPLTISIKTRIGVEEPAEFERLLQIFNNYPVKELIIHLRTQKQFYRGQVYKEIYAKAKDESTLPLCYNGDLFTVEDIEAVQAQFPGTDRFMLGRGMLINPALATGRLPQREQLREFHDRLVSDYSAVLSGERDVLFKMKELMFWLDLLFDQGERAKKQIRKARNLAEYKMAVDALFREGEIRPPHSPFTF